MLQKLSYRNALRSAKDYAIYLMTMAAFAGLLIAFHSLLFSNDLQTLTTNRTELSLVLAVMLGLADFFILIIIAWLIHYMLRFMLEKRSREFASYLLFGMEKRKIASLFIRENLIMGIVAFGIGIFIGLFLQQVILTMYYSMMSRQYAFSLVIDPRCFALSAACYFSCFILSLFRIRRGIKKCSILSLMNLDRQNQELEERGTGIKQGCFILSFLYILVFAIVLDRGGFSSITILCMVLALIVSIYLLYYGASAFLTGYLRRKPTRMYRGNALFLFRQLFSKIKTMRFTMGTLTILFSVAIFGGGISGFFIDYMNSKLSSDYPFEVILHNDDPIYDFAEETKRLTAATPLTASHRYVIYENETAAYNTYLYTHLPLFGARFLDETGQPDLTKIRNEGIEYYDYDTYMKLSDYNRLRQMLGHEEVQLEKDQYLVQLSPRIYKEVVGQEVPTSLLINDKIYTCAGFEAIPFAQDGHNGADYCIIVPDEAAETMNHYYAQMAYDVEGEARVGLEAVLNNGRSGLMAQMAELAQEESTFRRAFGTRQIMTYFGDELCKADIEYYLRSTFISMIFPLVYMAIIYLCVAFTILMMQQVSESIKYRFRYEIIRKLGMSQGELHFVILKQLFWFCMIPILVAAIIGGGIVILLSKWFVLYSSLDRSVLFYFAVPFCLIFAIFLLYFGAAYRMFCKNV
ncbi:MAG: ABC transporter permease [Clostridium sp.]|jgi:hypothetical protein|nr:ABC transporter permease [Clostridium sp.]